MTHEVGAMSTPRMEPVMSNVPGSVGDVRDVSTVTSQTPGNGLLSVRDWVPPVWYGVVLVLSISTPYGWKRIMRSRPVVLVRSTLNAGALAGTLKKNVAMSGRSAEPCWVAEKLFPALNWLAATTVFIVA